jgi:hypothetical protein
MSEAQRVVGTSLSKPVYISCRFAPFLFSLILCCFDAPLLSSSVCLLLATFSELFLTKEYFSPGLVGLRWYFSFADSHGFPFLAYYSRPLPYVVVPADSSVFWTGLSCPTVLWFLAVPILGFWRGIPWGAIETALSLLNLANVGAFLKCYNTGKDEADIVASNLLAGADVSFKVPDDGNEGSSSGGNPEEAANEADDEEIV